MSPTHDNGIAVALATGAVRASHAPGAAARLPAALETGTPPGGRAEGIENALARIESLAGCDAAELAAIARFTSLHTVAARQRVFSRGDACAYLYGLLSGSAKLVRGARQVLELLAPGALFGEHALFLGHGHSCTALTTSECRILALSADAMLRHLHTHGSTARAIMANLSARIVRLEDQNERLGRASAGGRVAAFLVAHSDARGYLALPVAGASRRDLAALLQLRPETLSRALSRFRREGWLRASSDGREWVDRDALLAL